MKLRLIVNGEAKEWDVRPGEFLAETLQSHGYASVKTGCDIGSCGPMHGVGGRQARSLLLHPHGADGGEIRHDARGGAGRGEGLRLVPRGRGRGSMRFLLAGIRHARPRDEARAGFPERGVDPRVPQREPVPLLRILRAAAGSEEVPRRLEGLGRRQELPVPYDFRAAAQEVIDIGWTRAVDDAG